MAKLSEENRKTLIAATIGGTPNAAWMNKCLEAGPEKLIDSTIDGTDEMTKLSGRELQLMDVIKPGFIEHVKEQNANLRECRDEAVELLRKFFALLNGEER